MSQPDAYTCGSLLLSDTTVQCNTQADRGVAGPLKFRVRTGVSPATPMGGTSMQLAQGTDSYNYPASPLIFQVTGCPSVDPSNPMATADCPSDGKVAGLQVVITIIGTNFGYEFVLFPSLLPSHAHSSCWVLVLLTFGPVVCVVGVQVWLRGNYCGRHGLHQRSPCVGPGDHQTHLVSIPCVDCSASQSVSHPV